MFEVEVMVRIKVRVWVDITSKIQGHFKVEYFSELLQWVDARELHGDKYIYTHPRPSPKL